MIEITKEQARSLQITSLGLGNRSTRVVSKDDLLTEILRMGVLQIDTIHVVARSPYLVLWSRLGNYPQHWLDDLLAEKRIFEFWAHAACFLPIEDYPLFRWEMEARRSRWDDPETWLGQNAEFVRALMEHVRRNGPVKSADFKRPTGVKGTWWDWKIEKIALEQLFLLGEIMIAKRDKFQRIYDLAERVHPDLHLDGNIQKNEAYRILTSKTVKALGVALQEWIADYYRLPKTGLVKILKELLDRGEIQSIKIEGFESSGYIHSDTAKLIETNGIPLIDPLATKILSPFDPLVWDRSRLKSLFGVDYRLECYLPKPKRRFGYWLLPILHKNKIIGRMDAKANRQRKVFEIKSLYIEDNVQISEDLISGLTQNLLECAQWHKTPAIEIGYCSNPSLRAALDASIIMKM